MKLLSASQIREWDAYTIRNEPISSLDLMERAATACYDWLMANLSSSTSFTIVCGTGNNGGDGLVIARLLSKNNRRVGVIIIGESEGSPDFQANLGRLHDIDVNISRVLDAEALHKIRPEEVIVEAIFGSGLNKPPGGLYAAAIAWINNIGRKIISIDIPAGLFADGSSKGNCVIEADYTLTFQQPKVSFFLSENRQLVGQVHVLDIGLSPEFLENANSEFFLTDKKMISGIYKPRKEDTHKGNFGYACLLAGSSGMMGAAVLSAKACLRSGVGKLTCYTCGKGNDILQATVPEAMTKTFGTAFIKNVKKLEVFDVIGVGPGIGRHESHLQLLSSIFENSRGPVVIDADGLNTLAQDKKLYKKIPRNSVITPHPKEFEVLFGKSGNDFERIQVAKRKSADLGIIILLKGHHTFIASPDGRGFFNSTGNSGMATAGAGDVLTGIITSLLAQHYEPLDGAIFGAYLHGLAGDKAAESTAKESMIAGDIVDHVSHAFLDIREYGNNFSGFKD